MTYSLGVDLGTTYVAAAISRPSGTEMVTLSGSTVVAPALVYLREDDVLVTGEAARRRAVTAPDRVGREFKRRLGDPTPIILGGKPFGVTTLLGALLRDVLDQVRDLEGGGPERVALTHPANWGGFRQGLFEEVPATAGLGQTITLTEPEAAAAHYAESRQLKDGQIVAVYDLGGGTFDATVLRGGAGGVEILGRPEGIERLGGVDFDESILAHVNFCLDGALNELDLADPAIALALARLRQDCMQAKESLSADTETVVPVFLPGRHTEVTLTRGTFEDMIRAPLESTTATLLRTVRSANLEPSDLSAVLLVGGSSRIPLVAEMVSAELGCKTVVDAHPKYTVALGAATYAAFTSEQTIHLATMAPAAAPPRPPSVGSTPGSPPGSTTAHGGLEAGATMAGAAFLAEAAPPPHTPHQGFPDAPGFAATARSQDAATLPTVRPGRAGAPDRWEPSRSGPPPVPTAS
ncbi:MAG TPA: Hsp70 family protein, partial [Pseudonocardia sp.]